MDNAKLHENSTIRQLLIQQYSDAVLERARKKIEKLQLPERINKYKYRAKFVILIDKIVQYQRPRANFHQKGVYDPPASKQFKKKLQQIVLRKVQAFKERFGFEKIKKHHPVQLIMNIYIKPPKSTSEVDKYLMELGIIRPCVRPDVDNYMKNILDGINDVLTEDDGNVVSYYGDKFYSQEERIEFLLRY
jgi:Holliday junction resolvase RusA-like endonuclease